jgi:putative transposase
MDCALYQIMPRINRFDYIADDQFVHVRIQFNNEEFSFQNDKHFQLWEKIAARYLKKYLSLKLCDFIWMNSHAHFIFYVGKCEDLPKFMHDLCWRFSLEYNKMTKRKGHLFLQRYRCSVINDDKYAIACQRYVYRNQLKAKMVKKLKDTKWSSYHYYAYGKKNKLITPLRTYFQFGKDKKKRQHEFRVFVEAMLPHEEDLWRAKLKHPYLKTKKDLLKNHLEKYKVA